MLALALLLPACGISGGGTLSPTVAPGVPTQVVAIAGNGRVTLSWSTSGSATSFTVLRSQSSGGPYSAISSPATTTYADLGLDNGTDYYYVVTADNQYGTSVQSAEAKATPRFAVVSLAPGHSNHSLALFEDGTVWGWGLNNDGEVGNGVNNYQSSPALALGLPRVTALARGDHFSMALADDGTVWSWGENDYGQLGRGTGFATAFTPARIPNLSNITAISAGARHAIALGSDGMVRAWGDNNFGQRGDLNPLPSTAPALIPGLSNVVAISAGGLHNLVLKDDGTVWSWGINQSGSLGHGFTSAPIITPGQVINLTGVTQISAGGEHSLALRNDGTVWAWGYNFRGQIGDGTQTFYYPTPVRFGTLTGVVSIAAGSAYSLAAKGDGSVWACGENSGSGLGINGSLGVGPSAPVILTPMPVLNLTGVASVAGGGYFCAAVRSDGTVWTWGRNDQGQLGIGAGDKEPIPVQVGNLTGVTAVAAGIGHSVALRSDATVWTWGGNQQGQLGNGTTSSVTTPYPGQALNLTSVTAISAGGSHSMALRSNGTVWAWGQNSAGQIGNGTSGATPVSSPVQVTAPGVVYSAIAAGNGHSLALRSDGQVFAWGSNQFGQIGNGTTSASTPVLTHFNVPIPLPPPAKIVVIATGGNHNFALRDDNTLWAWGFNQFGSVGNGAVGLPVTTPVQVLTGVARMATGQMHSLAVGTDGSVWAWGTNGTGELGLGAPGPHMTTPTPVPGLTGFSDVAAGHSFSVALKNDGTVWSWGYNFSAQLGDGTATDRPSPVQVLGLSGITAISSRYTHTLALGSGNLAWAWGSNTSQVLGTPFLTVSLVPVVITR
jgi:alpha-tubulin suppressor-like RCC1 family protein